MPLDDRHIVHKGRGATFNPQRPLREHRARSVRRRLGLAGAGARRRSAAAHRGHARCQPQRDRAQQLAGHPVRPLDQSLSRLRARLRLLLRAADATPISACRRGSISRPSCSPSSTRRACSSASSPSPAIAASRSRSAPTPTPTSRWSGGCGSRAACSRCSRAAGIRLTIVTKSAAVVRDLDLLAPMARDGPGAGRDLGDHARSAISRAGSSRAPRRRIAGCRRSGS